jgi:hypothetical protein
MRESGMEQPLALVPAHLGSEAHLSPAQALPRVQRCDEAVMWSTKAHVGMPAAAASPTAHALTIVAGCSSAHESAAAADSEDMAPAQNAGPEFVSQSSDMKAILSMARPDAAARVRLHRVGASLVLDSRAESTKSPESRDAHDEVSHISRELSMLGSDGGGGHLISNANGDPRAKAASAAQPPNRAQTSHAGGQHSGSQRQVGKVFMWQLDSVKTLLACDTVIQDEVAGDKHMRAHHLQQGVGMSANECLNLWLDSVLSDTEAVALCYHAEGSIQVRIHIRGHTRWQVSADHKAALPSA